jgi:hypothetical protein
LDYPEKGGSKCPQNSLPINNLHAIISDEKRILKYIPYQLRYFWNLSTALYNRINVSKTGSVPVMSTQKDEKASAKTDICEQLFRSTHNKSSNLKSNMPVSKHLGNLQ